MGISSMAFDHNSSATEPTAAPADRTQAPPPRRTGLWIGVVIVLAAAAGGWFGWQHYGPALFPAEAQAVTAPAAPPTVTVSPPLIKNIIEWDEYTGQFESVEEVEVRARVSGYLQSVNFTDGQIVRKGDLLYVIDPRPFEIALASAEAQLAAAQAAVDLAQAQLKRAEALQKNDFVSRSAYDERQQEARASIAEVGVARAAVERAKLDLEYTRITAPVTGRISATAVDVGNLVTGGNDGSTQPLTTIVSLDPIRLVFDVSEANLLEYQRAFMDGRLKSPRANTVAVQARLMDEDAWTIDGTLDFIDNQVDRTSGTIRVRALLPNPGNIITPGQFGQIRIPASEPYDALIVPEAALVTDQAQKVVLTVAEDGTVVPKPVRAGPNRGPQLRIIREGLTPGDKIIIDGLLRARPGGKVTPVEGSFDLPDPEE
jgi:RND family efflux transporter MFP subunit